MLLSNQPYGEIYCSEKALDVIVEGNGNHFDTLIVKIFVAVEKGISISVPEWHTGDNFFKPDICI
ncbi:MAG TPA: hypothetical protein VIK09_02895 [Candidatus Humimicrobiaceae bacterium]